MRIEKKEDPFARGYGVPDSINFREVKVGVMTSRVIFLYNEATEPCRFCFAVQVKLSNTQSLCVRVRIGAGRVPSLVYRGTVWFRNRVRIRLSRSQR